MVMDVPNTFIHTHMPPEKYGEEIIIMKTTGVLVYMLVELDSDMYRKYVVFENKKQTIYVFCVERNLWNACSSAFII